jgi:hypothetical protein
MTKKQPIVGGPSSSISIRSPKIAEERLEAEVKVYLEQKKE